MERDLGGIRRCGRAGPRCGHRTVPERVGRKKCSDIAAERQLRSAL